MQTIAQNPRFHIGIYIEIPELKMGRVAPLLFTGLLTEPLRCALEREKLLLAPPPLPAAEEDASKAANQCEAIFQQLPAGDKGLDAAIATMRNFLRQIQAGRGIQIFAYFNWFLLLVEVSDVALGLQAVQRELERLNLLQFAEIAHIDPVTTPSRAFYPPGFDKPFERHLSLVKQLSAYGRNLLEGGMDA